MRLEGRDTGHPASSSLRAREPAGVALSGTGGTLASEPLPLIGASGASRRRFPQWLLEGRGWRWLRPVIDLLLLTGAIAVTVGDIHARKLSSTGELVLFAMPLLTIALFTMRGLYRLRLRTLILDGVVPVVGSVSIAAMVIVVTEVYAVGGTLDASIFVRAWMFSLLAVGTGRVVMALSQRWARSNLIVGRPALIVGAGLVGAHVARRLDTHPEYGLRPVGFLDDKPQSETSNEERHGPVLGSPADLATVARITGARHVILAFSAMADSGFIPLVKLCDELGLEVSVVPRLFDTLNDRATYETLGGLPLIALRRVNPRGWMFATKHALDRGAALIMLLALAPLLIILALVVKLTSPGPVLFRQARVGRDGWEFDLLKFRSMSGASVPSGHILEADSAPGGVEGADRRTAVGRLLRRASLDELPQLLNVLRGEMSLIGPRPERPEFVKLFSHDLPRYNERHRVKSGITGWAQVHGLRGQTSLADRVEWDNYYIANWSLKLDLKILVLTVAALFRHAE